MALQSIVTIQGLAGKNEESARRPDALVEILAEQAGLPRFEIERFKVDT